MANTTAADLAAGSIAMVGEARYTLEHQAVMTNLVDRRTLAPGEKSLLLPKFGSISASDLTDGIDMSTSETMTITGTTHTTDEAGCKVIITKKLRQQLKEDAYRAAGKIIGSAMAKKIDTDILALFSGLDSGLGSSTTTFSIDYFLAAVTQCNGQSEPCPMPMACILHPYTIHEIVDEIVTPGASYAVFPPEYQLDLLKNYFRGADKLFNVPIFSDGNLTRTLSGATYSTYGAIISRMALIYLVGWEPENWVEEDKSLRGWEIGIVADYGAVEEDGTYGRYLQFYSTAPTS